MKRKEKMNIILSGIPFNGIRQFIEPIASSLDFEKPIICSSNLKSGKESRKFKKDFLDEKQDTKNSKELESLFEKKKPFFVFSYTGFLKVHQEDAVRIFLYKNPESLTSEETKLIEKTMSDVYDNTFSNPLGLENYDLVIDVTELKNEDLKKIVNEFLDKKNRNRQYKQIVLNRKNIKFEPMMPEGKSFGVTDWGELIIKDNTLENSDSWKFTVNVNYFPDTLYFADGIYTFDKNVGESNLQKKDFFTREDDKYYYYISKEELLLSGANDIGIKLAPELEGLVLYKDRQSFFLTLEEIFKYSEYDSVKIDKKLDTIELIKGDDIKSILFVGLDYDSHIVNSSKYHSYRFAVMKNLKYIFEKVSNLNFSHKDDYTANLVLIYYVIQAINSPFFGEFLVKENITSFTIANMKTMLKELGKYKSFKYPYVEINEKLGEALQKTVNILENYKGIYANSTNNSYYKLTGTILNER